MQKQPITRLSYLFRKQSCAYQFDLPEGASFQQQIKVHTQVEKAEKRFGIDQGHINKFISKLLQFEVDGRCFRTKYQIEITRKQL